MTWWLSFQHICVIMEFICGVLKNTGVLNITIEFITPKTTSKSFSLWFTLFYSCLVLFWSWKTKQGWLSWALEKVTLFCPKIVCWSHIHSLFPILKIFQHLLYILFIFFISKLKFKFTKMHKFDLHKNMKIQKMVITYLFYLLLWTEKCFFQWVKFLITSAKIASLWAISFLLIIFPVKINIHI